MIKHVEGLDERIKSYYEHTFGVILKDKALVLTDILKIYENDMNKFKDLLLELNENEVYSENLLGSITEHFTNFMKNYSELGFFLKEMIEDVDVLLKDKPI